MNIETKSLTAGHAALAEELRTRLEETRRRRPGYSGRAFARDMGVSPSQLAEILSFRRPVTPDLGSRILARLGLSPSRTRVILANLQEARPGRPRKADPNAIAQALGGTSDLNKTIVRFSRISDDQFALISEWYCLAILELATTRGFLPDTRWIAKRLGIQRREAQSAIGRLLRLGLLKKTSNGAIATTGEQIATRFDVPNVFIQKHHVEALSQASRMLAKVPVPMREFLTLTVATDPKKIEHVKKIMRRALAEVNEVCGNGPKFEVYRLCMQFFPVTRVPERSQRTISRERKKQNSSEIANERKTNEKGY